MQFRKTHIPGYELIHTYKRQWFSFDLVAGLSVAAVALPVGIAYAQLAGFPPSVGIYSSILPAVAYAFFGSSKQLVVNPDSAACMMVAATVTPLAAGDALRYMDISLLLTFMTGILCIAGSILKFGVIANFLSLPILTGYLNGIALTIISSQLGNLLGFKINAGGFFHTLWEAGAHLTETQVPTLILGLTLFTAIMLIKHFLPKVPAPLVATIAGIIFIYSFNLANSGIAVIGPVDGGFPVPRIPPVKLSELSPLFFGACGIVLVSFCSMMTTARAFAAKNGYRIKVNQDMGALGAADLASAISGGFAVSGADSRTAVANASGGKSQMTSIIAAVLIALVLLFLTQPLAYVPVVGLAAILMSSALGLFDFASLRRYQVVSKTEFRQSLIAMLGVMTIGVLPGIFIAVGLAIFNLLRMASRPHDAVLGPLKDYPEVYTGERGEDHSSIPGILIYRFDSSLLFFNADYFLDRASLAIREASEKPKWFIFDAEAIPLIDITGCAALEKLHLQLSDDDIVLVVARAKGLFRSMLKRYGIWDNIGESRFYYNIHSAVKAFNETKLNDLKEVEVKRTNVQ